MSGGDIFTPISNSPISNVQSTGFTRNLTLGSEGADVRTLQQFLNTQGYLLATSGPGSPNNESTLFGPKTQAALARYQAANHITPASGFFGPVSREVVNRNR